MNNHAKVISTIASTWQAIHTVNAEVDVIVAHGWQASCHIFGEVATLPFVAAVIDSIESKASVVTPGELLMGVV